jgi:murein L,D-transpeptidase YafK
MLGAAIGITAIGTCTLTRPKPNADRVTIARANQTRILERIFANAKAHYPPRQIYVRAFKSERELEVWARSDAKSKFSLIQTYPIVAMSGELGPKRKEGDLQAPEGLYVIDRFNPTSNYHLSLGLNYPNRSDRILGDQKEPGSNIFIHGSNVSIGCLAMTDDKIEQIYLMALEAKGRGQSKIRVDIFPFRMAGWNLKLRPAPKGAANLWMDLRKFFDDFEATQKPSAFRVDAKGRYILVKPTSTP